MYEITFSTESGFNKTVKLAFNNIEAEIIKGNAVFKEDFEGELPECFVNTPNTSIKEDADSNRYMYVDARGDVFNSPLFGGTLVWKAWSIIT